MEPQEPREDNPYYCEICKYTAKTRGNLMQHFNTIKHRGGGKNPMSKTNKKDFGPNCKYCAYTTNIVSAMAVHVLTNHSTSEERKARFTHYCDQCDVGTFSTKLHARHCETKKHKFNIEGPQPRP
jgi:hypothetical protein